MRKDIDGISGIKALGILFVVLAVAVLMLSGLIGIQLPTTDNEYEQTVKTSVNHIGMTIPIEIRLQYNQVAGDDRADISVRMKHRHEGLGSDGNYVPDPQLITTSTYNTAIGSITDTNTIFAVNGNPYQAGTTTVDIPVATLDGAYTGPARDNFMVWTNANTYQPPASNPTVDNHGIIIQLEVKYYRKATNQLLNSFIVNFLTYYQMPSYNVDDSWVQTYKYNLYIPFDDYARFQDIDLDILGYSETCIIEWLSVTSVTHTFWSFPVLNTLLGTNLKLAQTKDVSIPTAINYHWEPLIPFGINNGDIYGSHSYTYKIR